MTVQPEPRFYHFQPLPNDPVQDCRICLEPIANGDYVVELPCGENAEPGSKHIYHWKQNPGPNDCTLEKWLVNNPDCPLCRTSVDVQDLKDKEIIVLRSDSDCNEDTIGTILAIAAMFFLVILSVFIDEILD